MLLSVVKGHMDGAEFCLIDGICRAVSEGVHQHSDVLCGKDKSCAQLVGLSRHAFDAAPVSVKGERVFMS